MNGYIYYPGCSLKGNSKHYEESILPVFREIDMQLDELEDWNCCGATAYFSVDAGKAAAICGRNLSLAENLNKDIIAPCAGCYLTLKKSNKFLAGGTEKAQKILRALDKAGCSYSGQVDVKHPLEVLVQDQRLDKIKARVERPLKGLRVACYYGCQLVRPFTDFDDPDYPVSLDRLMAAIGAEPVDFSGKTRCCGGSLTGTIEEVGLRLNYILLKEAKRKGADVISTICPLCQFNLEILQDKMVKKYKDNITMPILYFSQLIGLAMGLPKEDMGFSRSIIDLKPLWEKIG
ncbi:MAG: CoB--CoM heterodisulfide reductase iron-sulfur subunit B family protein [Clostridiales bacterium]|nr:CoB--CoM heterodisulfide reductase iron-sulfur subunit B family protein [Clostridiales bacterium]